MKTENLKKKSKEQITKDYDKIVKYVIKDMGLGYKFDDLYDVGIIGFVRGINGYDENKNSKITTYLYECIKNEILKYLEQENKKGVVVSLNTTINNDIELIDIIPSYEEYDEKLYLDEMLWAINRRLSFLKERDEIIFKHLYGLDGYKVLSYEELGKKFNMTKQNITRIRKKVINILKYTTKDYYKTYQDLLSSENKRHIKEF